MGQTEPVAAAGAHRVDDRGLVQPPDTACLPPHTRRCGNGSGEAPGLRVAAASLARHNGHVQTPRRCPQPFWPRCLSAQGDLLWNGRPESSSVLPSQSPEGASARHTNLL